MPLVSLPVVGPVRVRRLEHVDVLVVVGGEHLGAVAGEHGAGHVGVEAQASTATVNLERKKKEYLHQNTYRSTVAIERPKEVL